LPKETFLRLRDEKQESILRSAIHEFVTHGFERAKISDIAKNAGVATGSIYQYFKDKAELFMYCAEWGVDVFIKKIDLRADIKSMDIFEYYNERLSKSAVLSEERELVLFMEEFSRHPDMMYPSLRAMYEKNGEYIMVLLQNSKAKGLIRDDIPDEILMEYFIAVTERFKIRWMRQNESFSELDEDLQSGKLSEEVPQMMELLKYGLVGQGSG
jgi:AcrR family transcriptional regulator